MKKIFYVTFLLLVVGACTDSTDTTTETTQDTTSTVLAERKSTPIADELLSSNNDNVEPTNSFLNPSKIKSQVFEIDPTVENTIIGENGVKVTIPANAFTDLNGSLVNNYISFELKEIISKKDMILSGLATVTNDGDVLESGGMFYTNATADGKQLKLADGVIIGVEVPTDEVKEDMLMWRGKEVEGEIVWEKPEEMEDPDLVDYVLKPHSKTKTTIDEETGKITSISTLGKCIMPCVLTMDEFKYLTYEEMDKVMCGVYSASSYRGTIKVRKDNNCEQNDIDGFASWKSSSAGKLPTKVPKDYIEKLRYNNLTFNEQDASFEVNSLSYKLGMKEIGWCNIDRIAAKRKGNKIRKGTIVATTNRPDNIVRFQICLVFKDRNIFIPGLVASGSLDNIVYGFGSLNKEIKLPVGDQAYIVAMGFDGANNYCGAVDFTIEKGENNRHLTLSKTDDVDAFLEKVLQ